MNNISLSDLKIYLYGMRNDGESSQILINSKDSIDFLKEKNSLRSFLSTHHVLEIYFKDMIVTMKDSISTSFYFNFSLRYHINFPIGIDAHFSIYKNYSVVNEKLIMSYLPFIVLNILHIICSMYLLVYGYKVLEDIIYISRRITILDKNKDRPVSPNSSLLMQSQLTGILTFFHQF
jgi:hypothetical protein